MVKPIVASPVKRPEASLHLCSVDWEDLHVIMPVTNFKDSVSGFLSILFLFFCREEVVSDHGQ